MVSVEENERRKELEDYGHYLRNTNSNETPFFTKIIKPRRGFIMYLN